MIELSVHQVFQPIGGNRASPLSSALTETKATHKRTHSVILREKKKRLPSRAVTVTHSQ